MKKKTNCLRYFRILIVNILIFSLIQNPFINQAFAQANNPAKDVSGGVILDFAQKTLGLYSQYLGTKAQMIQQQMASAQARQMMEQMSPACRKPDGSPCFGATSKFFPDCPLPASMSNMPQNICANATPEPAQISQMISYEAIANTWTNYYDQMMNTASNAATPIGLKCLEDKQKNMDSQIIEMMNSLQRLKDRLNQDKQIFRDNNKKLLEEMNIADQELNGSEGGKNLALKTQDLSKLFSQSCQTIIGKESMKELSSKGLNNLLQEVSPKSKEANDFDLNKGSLEADIRSQTDRLVESVKSQGLGDFVSTLSNNTSVPNNSPFFQTISNQAKKQVSELGAAKTRIDGILKEVGYTAPPLDKNFSADLDDFMAGANDFFKKKYVNDCVTGADRGVAIPINDILNSLQQKSTGSAGTARNDYRIALKKILDSDSMIEDKMANIKALEASYPDITLTYKDSSQKKVTESPYNLFMKTISVCEQKFSQNDQFTSAGASNGSSNVSAQKKVDRARSALQELKSLNDSFASKLQSSILSSVLDCNGEAYKSGSCTTESLAPASNNFCIAHASQCANEIKGCYAEADAQVQKRKNKLESNAKAFNTNVATMIERSNQLYEQQKQAVTNITKMLQQRFPGTNFEIPGDMFVKMPEMKKDRYGVEMAGDGKLESFLDGPESMPSKIDKLKEIFAKQKDTVDKEVGDYISKQKEAMTTQKQRWADLAKKCDGAIKTSSDGLAKMNAEGQKKQQELDGKTANFCRKYNSISKNPIGGCNQAKDLASSMNDVTGRITNQASDLAIQYANACDGYMNEKNISGGSTSCNRSDFDTDASYDKCVKRQGNGNSQTTSSTSTPPPTPKSAICPNKDNTSDEDFLKRMLAFFPTSAREKLKDIKEIKAFREKISSEGITDNSIFDQLNEFADNYSKTDGNPCKQIYTILNSETDTTKKQKLQEELDKKVLSPLAELQKSSSTTDAASKDPSSVKQTSSEIVQNIGQQMTGACDAQNNTSLAKGFDGGFNLNSYDQQRLGNTAK
jgi:hypothetical protein